MSYFCLIQYYYSIRYYVLKQLYYTAIVYSKQMQGSWYIHIR